MMILPLFFTHLNISNREEFSRYVEAKSKVQFAAPIGPKTLSHFFAPPPEGKRKHP